MSIEIKAPTFPESVQEGTIATWHKQPGEAVSRDELLVEIETDKVVLEVVAPADGTLVEVLKAEGSEILSNEIIALIEAGEGAAVNTTAAEEAPASPAAATSSLDIKAPTFPESVQEGTIATWHKKAGETVSRDELLVDIETDKVVLEVVAPADGTLAEVLKSEGEIILSNELIARVETGTVSVSSKAEESSSAAAVKRCSSCQPNSQEVG